MVYGADKVNNNNLSTTVFGCIVALLGVVGIGIVSAILNGWAVSTLWGWFVVPIFGLPDLGILQAIGISLLISVFKTKGYDSKKDGGDAAIALLLAVIISPVLSVIVGYILLQLM